MERRKTRAIAIEDYVVVTVPETGWHDHHVVIVVETNMKLGAVVQYCTVHVQYWAGSNGLGLSQLLDGRPRYNFCHSQRSHHCTRPALPEQGRHSSQA
jgi:hypothetical protein